MEDLNFRKGDAKTDVFGSDRMLQPSPVEKFLMDQLPLKSLTRWLKMKHLPKLSHA